ncbi:hypothetical protein GN241_10995 [Rhodobacteraceae bacterium IMCC1335]
MTNAVLLGQPSLGGLPGATGTDGLDGASAYEIAVANGFQGTEAEWLASLEMQAGFMVLAKAEQSFPGFLECDGSTYDETLYPDLAALGFSELGPASVIDLGLNGQLILPVTVKWGGQDYTYYAYDKGKNGASDEGVRFADLAVLINGGTPIDETLANRSGTINGVEVIVPLLGRTYSGGATTPTATADPTVNNTTYTDLLAVWDAYATPATPAAWPAGWKLYHWMTATDSGRVSSPYAILWRTGSVGSANALSVYPVALEVPSPPMQTIYPLPDSAALGAPEGYSYYIKY